MGFLIRNLATGESRPARRDDAQSAQRGAVYLALYRGVPTQAEGPDGEVIASYDGADPAED